MKRINNLYLTYFDHWIKEEIKCKFYFRYADDIIVLGSTKKRIRKSIDINKNVFSSYITFRA